MTGKFFKSPHFWANIAITLVLIFIYRAWPWRSWDFDESLWRWFWWLSPLYTLAIAEFVHHIIGILFLVPIIYAAIIFSWRGALVAYLLSLFGVLPITLNVWSLSSFITNMTLLLLPLFIASIIAFELARRRRERKNFTEREAERKVNMSKILESQENERQRIAQEIHDDTIQKLLVIANRTQKLIPCAEGENSEINKNTEWLRDATLQAIEDLRRTSLNLRPSVLDDLGLVPALRWLVDNIIEESNIKARIIIKGPMRNLRQNAEITIFRVVQEALNNIKRHSKAKEAFVIIEFKVDSIKITIKDNGTGFYPPRKFEGLATKGKLGLIGMQQRIELLGGKFQIHSRPGRGTLLQIEAIC